MDLVRGEITIFRTREDGVDEVLATETPGTYFGEMGPLLGLPRSASARAAGETVVSALSVRDFKQCFSAVAGNVAS